MLAIFTRNGKPFDMPLDDADCIRIVGRWEPHDADTEPACTYRGIPGHSSILVAKEIAKRLRCSLTLNFETGFEMLEAHGAPSGL